MTKVQKLEILLDWFDRKLLSKSLFSHYLKPGGTIGGSATNCVERQFARDREKIKNSLKRAEKIFRSISVSI